MWKKFNIYDDIRRKLIAGGMLPELTQRKGRIERQGNQNQTVYVCRYVTEDSFDAYL